MTTVGRAVTIRVLDDQFEDQPDQESFLVRLEYPRTSPFDALGDFPPIVNPVVEVVVEDIDAFHKNWSNLILKSSWFQLAAVICTIYALFGYEAVSQPNAFLKHEGMRRLTDWSRLRLRIRISLETTT